MNTENVVLNDKKVSLSGKMFIGESPSGFAIVKHEFTPPVLTMNSKKRIIFNCEEKDVQSYGIVASGIITVEEVNEIISQLQTLADEIAKQE